MQMFTILSASQVAAPGLHLDFTRGPIQDWQGDYGPEPVNVGVFTMPMTIAQQTGRTVRPLLAALLLCTTCTALTIHQTLMELGQAYERLFGSEWFLLL